MLSGLLVETPEVLPIRSRCCRLATEWMGMVAERSPIGCSSEASSRAFWRTRLLASPRRVRFKECEYAVPHTRQCAPAQDARLGRWAARTGAGRSGPEREIGHAASAWGDSEKLGVYQEPARRDSVPSFMLRPRLTSANQRVISR